MSDDAFSRSPLERVGPYRLVSPVGKGGFSEVWRAVTDQGDVVALKLLIHPEHLAQLRQEASALALVRGEGIVPIVGMSLTDDPPWIALALIDGGNLRHKMRDGAFAATEAIVVFERILEILARVHNEGIVHGDLKPENVLFHPGQQLFLADFGLSRRITQRSASLSVSLSLEDARLAGTLDYMAPEQRSGERPSARSDVFACGVLLYELLTGERPQGVFKMPSELDPSLPPVVDRLIACSLAQDPRHRFASAGPMLAFLRAGVAGDWKDLAAAQKRLQALESVSAASQAHSPGTTISAICIALATLFIMFCSLGVFQKPENILRFFAGAASAVGVVFLVARAARPWLGARYANIVALKEKVELQIKTGGEWSRAVKNRPRIKVTAPPGARGGARSSVWPPPPRPPATKLGARGLGSLAFIFFLAVRACGTMSRTSYTPPPYIPPPVPQYPPFTLPPVPPDLELSDLRYPDRTSAVAAWHLPAAARDVAPLGTCIYAATEAGIYRLTADGRAQLFALEGQRLIRIAAGGERVAAADAEGTIHVVDDEGEEVRTFVRRLTLPGPIVVSPDGTRVIYALGQGVHSITLRNGRQHQVTSSVGIVDALVHPSVDYLAGIARSGVRFHLDPREKMSAHHEGGYGEAARRAGLSRNGRYCATQDALDCIRVTNMDAVFPAPAHRGARAARLAPSDDGAMLLLVSEEGELYLHDLRAGMRSKIPGDAVRDAVFTSGARFVTVSASGRDVALRSIDR